LRLFAAAQICGIRPVGPGNARLIANS
jgi:hypothetical protein